MTRNCSNTEMSNGSCRRTIVRYLNLSFVLTLRLMCLPVKKRFPSLAHLVEAGILTEGEKKIIDKMDDAPSTNKHPKYWVPLVWAGSVITRNAIQCCRDIHNKYREALKCVPVFV